MGTLGSVRLLLALCCALPLHAVAQSQSTPLDIQKIANNSTIVLSGYNATGVVDTAQYYGPYTEGEPTATEVPEPNVPADIVPGCNILNQFSIANYTGPIPCETNASAPCQNMTGKVVFITGASTGIGRAAANRFAAAGAIVVGTSRWPWRYPAPPNWELYAMDQTSSESVKQAIDRVAVTHGRIDVLYMNAGNQYVGDTVNSDLRQMMLTFDTNFWGSIRVLQAALPLMPTSGYARILLTTSVESQIAAPGYLPYTASKWALMALQEEWYSSHESTGHPTNIDFVTILPGTVNTSLGYSVSYGCPQLLPQVGQQVINAYKQMGLDPKAVGEAAYRLAINPAPPLRNIIMTDDQFSSLLPLWCRRYTQPLENFYTRAGTPSIDGWLSTEATQHMNYNCSSQCGGSQFCGAGTIYGDVAGRGSVVGYPASVADTNI